MKRTVVFILTIIAAIMGCSGSTESPISPPNGPLAMGIVSGNNQVVTAGHDSLPNPVVGQMVRLPNGTVAFHILKAGNSLLDAIVPRAFAQTVVNGSPVPGAVVCAVSVDSVHKLTPWTPCTNTDAGGKATFFFTTGTTAGVASAQIRGTLNSQPAVFDTAKATVTADAAAKITTNANGGGVLAPDGARLENSTVATGIMVNVGMRIAVKDLLPACSDMYGNAVAQCPPISWGIYAASTAEVDRVAQSSADTVVVVRPSGTPQSWNGGDLDLLYLFIGSAKKSIPLVIVNGPVGAFN